MDELETTFGLEDILREFGSPSARPEPEELFPAPEPEIPEEPEPAEEMFQSRALLSLMPAVIRPLLSTVTGTAMPFPSKAF